MDYLKFDGQPTFDVLAKTEGYSKQPPERQRMYWADEYLFRGSVIGPITGKVLHLLLIVLNQNTATT